MVERRPDNLKLLSEAFGGQHVIENIFTGESLVVDGVEFVSGYVAESAPDRFYILKPMRLIERYRELAEFAHGGRVLELGIAEGGSAALLALWADPVMLATLDNEPTPLVALDDFARAHGFADRLRPFFGVDQGDRARVAEIADTEFAGEPIDFVIDDASHSYWPTRASFETLFPRLRPGGRYVIEDWEADVAMADAVRIALRDPSSAHHERAKAAFAKPPEDRPRTDRVSLTRLVPELVVLAGGQSGTVADISINKSFISVTKGDVALDPTDSASMTSA